MMAVCPFLPGSLTKEHILRYRRPRVILCRYDRRSAICLKYLHRGGLVADLRDKLRLAQSGCLLPPMKMERATLGAGFWNSWSGSIKVCQLPNKQRAKHSSYGMMRWVCVRVSFPPLPGTLLLQSHKDAVGCSTNHFSSANVQSQRSFASFGSLACLLALPTLPTGWRYAPLSSCVNSVLATAYSVV